MTPNIAPVTFVFAKDAGLHWDLHSRLIYIRFLYDMVSKSFWSCQNVLIEKFFCFYRKVFTSSKPVSRFRANCTIIVDSLMTKS